MARAGETRRRLIAGPLSAELAGPDLVDVRLEDRPVISRVFVSVRDEGWRTVEPVLRDVRVERSADGAVAMHVEAVHEDGSLSFGWGGTFLLSRSGELSFELRGSAERDLRYRRIGICILLPWRSTVGGTFRARDVGGSTEGSFPEGIAPQLLRDGSYLPMIGAFSELDVRLPSGVALAMSFEGELFELEDQRNWTDASFKIYPTPLARSMPRDLRAGERVSQRVRIGIAGATADASTPMDGPLEVRIGGLLGHRMPPVGVSAPTEPIALARVGAFRELHPAHVRVQVRPDTDDSASVGAAFEAARSTGLPLELAVLIDGVDTAAVRIGRLLPETRLARLLVHRSDGATIPSEEVDAVRRGLERISPGSLRDVAVIGGTWSSFSELNREEPDQEGIDGVALSMTPQVHARDERSMMGTLAIQGSIVRLLTASIGRPVVVSPVTLAIYDPFAPTELDPRLAGPFGAAWTLGSLGQLAAAGAASVTVHEAVDRALLLDPSRTRRVIAWASALRGAALAHVASTDQDRMFGLAGGGVVLMANLTEEPVEATIRSGTRASVVRFEPYETKRLER